jgi:hypothetical protein
MSSSSPSSACPRRRLTTVSGVCDELSRYLQLIRLMLKYLAKMPQCSVAHQLLPREQWTKAEEVGYTEATQLVARTNNYPG